MSGLKSGVDLKIAKLFGNIYSQRHTVFLFSLYFFIITQKNHSINMFIGKYQGKRKPVLDRIVDLEPV